MKPRNPIRPPAVFWCLSGSDSKASARLQGSIIDKAIRDLGYISVVILRTNDCQTKDQDRIAFEFLIEQIEGGNSPIMDGDILVLQKIQHLPIDRMAQAVRSAGGKTIYVECDYRPRQQGKSACDIIVATSSFLAEQLKIEAPISSIVLIEDPLEFIRLKEPQQHGHSYSIVWVGSKTGWSSLDMVQEVLAEREFADLRLYTISDHPLATYQWSLNSVFDHWMLGDVAVVPTGSDRASCCKSNNRVTQAMALYLPVVCGSIPAYSKLIQCSMNGFICSTKEDYRRAFQILRDPAKRQSMGRNGWARVVKEYNVETIVRHWIDMFTELSERFSRYDGSLSTMCTKLSEDWNAIRLGSFLQRKSLRSVNRLLVYPFGLLRRMITSMGSST